jgi:P27 family predicted phage terminase small subunit
MLIEENMQPRKSKELHALTGTKPHYKTDDETASVFVGGKPKMPKDLPPEAQTEWKSLVKELTKRGTLTRADSSSLQIYVVMWARWRKVSAMAQANPVTEIVWVGKDGEEHSKVVEHPASAMAARLENSLRNMLKELSATPASRERTKPTAPKPPKDAFPEGSVGALLAAENEQEEVTVEPNREI